MNRKFTSILALLLSVMLFVLPTLSMTPQVSAAKPPTATPAPPPSTINSIIPKPVSVTSTGGTFTLPATADIYVNPGSAEMIAIGQYLANKLNPSTGYGLTVIGTTSTPPSGNIYLTTVGGSSSLGTEGYDLSVTTGLISLVAFQPTGVFRGLQTIRQLFPAAIEKSTVQAGPWTAPTGTVHDLPRFGYRGHMLDIARHYFTIAELKREVDNMAYYKLSYFHIHLSDDQGWRIVINSWPNLTDYGSQTQVDIAGRTGDESCITANDGGPCYYTQAQYTDLVNYAAARYITIVPEIDMPGHTNAALASYASLNCNGIAPARYTGTSVGFSSLCVTQPIPAPTINFMNAVIDQLSAITPGPYFHIGGDEANSTPLADYKNFVSQAQARVIANGKKMLGWEESAQIDNYSSTSVAQHWNTSASFAPTAVSKGAKVLMSPCPYSYLDIKYSKSGGPAGLGLSWCGTDSVQNSYSGWDPATLVPGVPEASIIGVEGPLWAETIMNTSDIDQMAWPRLAGLAEIGWSPAAGKSWTEYRVRLGSHGPRLTNMGINFYRSPDVTWQ
jgi:N-acetyl-beta-hexosaminidase